VDGSLPGLELGALAAHLERTRPGLAAGPLRAELVAGGRSNLTYRVTDGRHRWILRRPPLGHVLATAHDMTREHRVLTALAGTAVPVPRTELLCADPAVLGAPFYLMQEVDGTVYRSAAQLRPLGPARTAALAGRLVATLADLHAVDPGRIGLADFGRPAGFLERQVRRWRTQLDASRSRDLPGADELHARLAARVPARSAVAVVHGDYRLDNLLIGPGDAVAAVLDWEMATLGDPLFDLALVLAYLRLGRLDTAYRTSDVGSAPGWPDEDRIVAAYAERSGRDPGPLAFHLGLAFYKIAVILEGIHYRYRRGQTVGAGFESVGTAVPPLIAAGLAALDEPDQPG
jgi:aminoglycoside phosphotransferase (APT) family kinase protein